MKNPLRLILCGALLALNCAIAPAQANDAAWRDAWVKKVVTGAELKNPAVRECLAAMPAETVATHAFAVLIYAKGRGWGYKTVPVPDIHALVRGEHVAFNLADCDAAVRRLAPAAPPQPLPPDR